MDRAVNSDKVDKDGREIYYQLICQILENIINEI